MDYVLFIFYFLFAQPKKHILKNQKSRFDVMALEGKFTTAAAKSDCKISYRSPLTSNIDQIQT